MENQEIKNELEKLIADYLNKHCVDLVEFNYGYSGMTLVLRILVDKPEGGISLDECAYLNNQICSILDEKDILQERYILEVSSPGLDRPLKTKKDYLRCINRKVRFFLSEQINNKIELEGFIRQAKDESVEIEADDVALEIAFDKIARAKQVIE